MFGRALATCASCGLLVALTAFIACDTTTTDPLTQPITGVTVQVETLIAGRGCGTAPSQVFKYVVVVKGADATSAADNTIPLSEKKYTEFQAANLYDCFTDGTFTNLPASNGLSAYFLEVYAFDQAAYLAAGGDQLVGLMVDLQSNRAAQDTDAANAAKYAAQVQVDLGTLRGKAATYTTTCTASQLEQVQTLALCKPLTVGSGDAGAPTTATITLPLATFTSADAGTYSCNADFATVRVTATIDGAPGPAIPTVGCSASPLTIPMASAPVSYSLAVTLVKGDESILGTTTCTADTSPGLTVTPTCQAVR